MRDQRRDRDHAWRVLAEHEGLDVARRRRVAAQVDEHDARVAGDDVPVVPLPLVPVKRLDQLRRIAAARVAEAAGHLREGLVGHEGAALVVDVTALELLDEVSALVGPLLERLDHDAVDRPEAFREWARGDCR